ncbi:hypothetical protein C0J52_04197 [Blattella germanica]|nr:hypothetical protein C0J52_04197 [Blattella germanica]
MRGTLSCDHTKVTPYFIESINSKPGFWAVPCPNQFLYYLGFCNPPDEQYVLMGEHVTHKLYDNDNIYNSYMIMLGIVEDGTLLPHLYALVSEPVGHFPANMIMNLPNIKAFASKSANMTKRDLKVSLEQAMRPDIGLHGKTEVLLLVDSWTTNRDDKLYNSTVPEGHEAYTTSQRMQRNLTPKDFPAEGDHLGGQTHERSSSPAERNTKPCDFDVQ